LGDLRATQLLARGGQAALRIGGPLVAGAALGYGASEWALRGPYAGASPAARRVHEAGMGLGGVVAGAALGGMMGGPAGALLGAGSAAIVGTGRMGYAAWQASRQARQAEQQFRGQQQRAQRAGYITPRMVAREWGWGEDFEQGLDPRRSRQVMAEVHRRQETQRDAARRAAAGPEQDPVVRGLRSAEHYLARLQESFSPEHIRRAIAEGQQEAARQQTARDLGTLKVQVSPSPEFAARMEWQQSLQMFRSMQVAVA